MVKPILRNTLRSDVVKKHARMKDELKGDLQKNSSCICLTTDLWTSLTTRSFLCLTAHYVDDNWKLNSKILNFSHVPPPHTAFELKTIIYRMLKEWGIDNKIFAITMDNASNMKNMQNELREQLNGRNVLLSHGKFFHDRCCGHILNLIVQDGLKVIRDGIRCVRESVKYVEGSEGRKIQFKECIEQSGVKCSKGLWLDVPTRWNSTFMMLDREIFYRQAFVNLSRIDKYYKDCPTPQDWEKMIVLANLLRPFDAITKLFSGTKYPTIILFFENVCQIHFQLLQLSTSPDDVLQKMGNVMISKFEKYWEDYNMVLAFGVIMDPCCKHDFVRFLYGKLGGEHASKCEDIGDQLKMLFEEYKIASPSSSLTSQSSTTRTCSSMDSFTSDFDTYNVNQNTRGKSELQIYLEDPREPRTVEKDGVVQVYDLDVLNYWKEHQYQYPQLSRMAKDILGIPITSVASESSFSLGGRVLNKWRSSMLNDTLEAVVTTRN